jgi:hypothetical protein
MTTIGSFANDPFRFFNTRDGTAFFRWPAITAAVWALKW